MKEIAVSIGRSINPGGTTTRDKHIPKSLNHFCPFCGASGVFTLSKIGNVEYRFLMNMLSTCPGCGEKVHFTIYYSHNAEEKEPVDISMYPSPDVDLKPMEVPNELQDRLVSAIRDAENSFRAGLYSPALTCAGRALEGILKHLTGDQEKKLYDLVEEFCKSDAAVKPLSELSHTIRKGRNVGAHFDELIEPSQESAVLVMELLRYLIQYFFIFEDRARQLSSQLSSSK